MPLRHTLPVVIRPPVAGAFASASARGLEPRQSGVQKEVVPKRGRGMAPFTTAGPYGGPHPPRHPHPLGRGLHRSSRLDTALMYGIEADPRVRRALKAATRGEFATLMAQENPAQQLPGGSSIAAVRCTTPNRPQSSQLLLPPPPPWRQKGHRRRQQLPRLQPPRLRLHILGSAHPQRIEDTPETDPR